MIGLTVTSTSYWSLRHNLTAIELSIRSLCRNKEKPIPRGIYGVSIGDSLVAQDTSLDNVTSGVLAPLLVT